MPAFNLQTCARPNIIQLVPYRCARDDYKDNGTNILLDANENAYGPSLPAFASASTTTTTTTISSLHRYPDPHQVPLKSLFCNFRNLTTSQYPPIQLENLFLGVGSDECIDALLRCFCTPGHDKILTCPPTYGMYAVSAQVNDIAIVKVDLDVKASGFPPNADAINAVLSSEVGKQVKLVYLCSPGNPTGALVPPAVVRAVLEHPTWNGVVVVDEAYVDFSPPGSSLASWVTGYPNLVVMQTLSKSFGLAGIRLGAAFTSPGIATLLNSVKAPYNISSLTSELAMSALGEEGLGMMRENVANILQQRERLVKEFPKIPGVGSFLGGFNANFLLVEMLDIDGTPSNVVALRVYERLAEVKSVVVRFRGKETGCTGCLRITVGTEKENDVVLVKLKDALTEVRR